MTPLSNRGRAKGLVDHVQPSLEDTQRRDLVLFQCQAERGTHVPLSGNGQSNGVGAGDSRNQSFKGVPCPRRVECYWACYEFFRVPLILALIVPFSEGKL